MKFHLIVVLLFLKTCVKDYGDRGLVIIYREGGGAGAMENMPSLIFAGGRGGGGGGGGGGLVQWKICHP